ncbi:hypothetical protein BH11PSE12_BH11PSE12_06560 [soil metagenome]
MPMRTSGAPGGRGKSGLVGKFVVLGSANANMPEPSSVAGVGCALSTTRVLIARGV